MANGKSAHATVAEVRSICHELEVSPSCHSETSPIYGGGGQTVKQPEHSDGGKTHAGSRGQTKEVPAKFNPANEKRGH
jgi:hypothetical protein